MYITQRQIIVRVVLHGISILALLTLLLTKLTLPASTDPGDGGRWVWDEEYERRVFIPEGRGPQRPTLAMDPLASPNGVTSPFIEADPQYEQIYGWDWPLGNTVYVCVDSSDFAADPTDPAQCDLFDDSMVAYAPSWDPTYGLVDFDVYPTLDLQGGQYISMTDTVTTKEHQVTSLTVTGVDAAADTVSGTADPGSLVNVYEYDGGNWLYHIADGFGDWLASYSGIYDLLPGSDGSASQYDADSDLTWWSWEVPNPTITAQPVYDRITGSEWPEGETVHVCVDDTGFAADPTNPAQCDFYDNVVVDPPSGPTTTYVSFDLSGTYDLHGGDYIAMTDGATVKQHQVTSLVITGADPVTDTVSGTAAPGSAIKVVLFGCSGCTLYINANGSGDWAADFSSIGQDIQPGDNGFAAEPDADGDETWGWWEVPNPRISASLAYEDVYANDWPVGANVHICIDATGFAANPMDPGQCDLYYDSAVIPVPGYGIQPYYRFDVGSSHDLQGGDYIAMTDGTTTKQHQVTNLDVTGVDAVTDIVSGTADPGTDVEVAIYDPFIVILDVVTNGGGDWQADFSSMIDLDVGSSGYATQFDGDGDETWERWSIDLPVIEVFPTEDWIDGYNWPEGSTVHLCINTGSFAADPTVPAQCSLYHDSMTAYIPPGWGDQTLVDFDLGGIFDIQPGQYVSLSDGVTRKDLLVANLAVTGWDVAADTITGTADPNADVGLYVYYCSGCYMDVIADGSGDWFADFSGIADLQPGDMGSAAQYDPDDDSTHVLWSIPLYELFLPLVLR